MGGGPPGMMGGGPGGMAPPGGGSQPFVLGSGGRRGGGGGGGGGGMMGAASGLFSKLAMGGGKRGGRRGGGGQQFGGPPGGQQFGGPPGGGGMQGGRRGRGGGMLGGLFGNKGRGQQQQQQFGGGMQGGGMRGGQQQQQFGQQGGYMGYQRSAPEIFRQEAPRQLQDAMVFLQPAAVMTAAAILGVAVFSDVGGSGGVDNARDRAASKVTLALDPDPTLALEPTLVPAPTLALALHFPLDAPFTTSLTHPRPHPHHRWRNSRLRTPLAPLHPPLLSHLILRPPSLHYSLSTLHPSSNLHPSTLHTLPFSPSRFPRRARPTASRCPRRKTTLECHVNRPRANGPRRRWALRRAP